MIKPRIGIYGRMNAGKSTLLNRITGQDIAIVSEHAGTTTDPVRRSYEILDFAPVIFIDTAGFDDTDSELGRERVAKTMNTLVDADLAILVIRDDQMNDSERTFLSHVTCPYIVVKNDGHNFRVADSEISIIDAIKQAIPLSTLIEPPFFGDRLSRGDIVLMVCPIDSEAPSGRLILPQVHAIRSALDTRAITVVVQPSELEMALGKIKPKLIVTDSQAFAEVTPLVPEGVELTSFSILLSELKGDPKRYQNGLNVLPMLKDGDKILLIEHCSHQSSCDDIARVKIPRLFKSKLGIDARFEVLRSIPEVTDARLIVQCGGCMSGRRAVMTNILKAEERNLAITNYGMLLRELQSR